MLRVYFEKGAQTVRTVPLRAGRAVVVAAATFALLDLRFSADQAEHIVASGDATLDAVSTTLTAPAGRGAPETRQLEVSSAAGILAGQKYLLVSGGRSELVTIEAVAGLVLRLAATLPVYFPSGAVLRGIEIAAEIPEDVAANPDYQRENVLALRWTAAEVPPFQEPVYVERVAASPLLTPDDVLSLDGTLAAYAAESMSVAQALNQANEDFAVDLLSAGIEDTAIMAGPIGAAAVKYLSAWHLIKHVTDTAAVARAEHFHKRYTDLLAGLLVGAQKKKTIVTDSENAKRPRSVGSLFSVGW